MVFFRRTGTFNIQDNTVRLLSSMGYNQLYIHQINTAIPCNVDWPMLSVSVFILQHSPWTRVADNFSALSPKSFVERVSFGIFELQDRVHGTYMIIIGK